MPAHRYVCTACQSETVRDIADIPDLAHQLDLAISRQTRVSSGGGSRGRETPLPYNQRASEAAHLLHSTVAAWVNDLRAGVKVLAGPACPTPCPHPTCVYITMSTDPGRSTAELGRWLLRHARVMLGRHGAADAVEQIGEAVREARRVIDRPLDRVYAGPCPRCRTDMYAAPGAALVDCPACVDGGGRRVSYGVQSRRAWMLAEIEEMLLPAGDIARALTTLVRPIQPALLYTWVQRKRLIPAGKDVQGRTLFRVGDVVALLEQRTTVVAPATIG